MSRPRKPSVVLELSGSFKKDPKRKRKDPETGGALGTSPGHLNKAERGIWNELLSIAPKHVLTEADCYVVEVLCKLINEMRTDWSNFTAAKLSRLEAMLGKLGMTPADRSKVSTHQEPPKERNPFMDL